MYHCNRWMLKENWVHGHKYVWFEEDTYNPIMNGMRPDGSLELGVASCSNVQSDARFTFVKKDENVDLHIYVDSTKKNFHAPFMGTRVGALYWEADIDKAPGKLIDVMHDGSRVAVGATYADWKNLCHYIIKSCGFYGEIKKVQSPVSYIVSGSINFYPSTPTELKYHYSFDPGLASDSVDASQYNDKCPKCGNPAYLGFANLECSNSNCINHPSKRNERLYGTKYAI